MPPVGCSNVRSGRGWTSSRVQRTADRQRSSGQARRVRIAGTDKQNTGQSTAHSTHQPQTLAAAHLAAVDARSCETINDVQVCSDVLFLRIPEDQGAYS
jgi:hypothetical protein